MLRRLGTIIGTIGAIYGVIAAVRLFFDFQQCSGGTSTSVTCQWAFAGWPLPLIVLLFVAYLPFTPLVSILFAWPAYAVGTALYWLAERRKPAPGSSNSTAGLS